MKCIFLLSSISLTLSLSLHQILIFTTFSIIQIEYVQASTASSSSTATLKLPTETTTTTTSATRKRLPSSSIKLPRFPNSNSNINIMTASKINNEQESSPSALRELKEVIQKQAKEIEQLKSSLAASSSSTTSKAAATSHGHGPPATEEDPSAYLSTPFYGLAFKRVGWLFIFLMSLSLTAVIMNGFEHTLSTQIELAYFVPLLAGHGGNTGGQTVGSVLSALSTNSVTKKDAFRVIRKEAMSGLTVGLILGTFIGLLSYHIGGISMHVSTVVFCTLPLLSTIAATMASTIPFACTALGLDPAIIAAPAMTTFVDVSGLLSYFLIANKIFGLFGLEL